MTEHWTEGDVLTNGIRMHYYRTGGDKPALVLAHGFSDNGLCWTPVARVLQADYDVIMIDARGHGKSEAPDGDYDPITMATDLAEWLVCRGVPFREAHHMVGRFVRSCASAGIRLDEATLEQMRETIPQAETECLSLFSATRSVAGRRLTGGTAPDQVERQLATWEKRLQS